ncbi:uncharacterized protein LOC121055204 [Oryza brachyantha]|uniref:uncharacterized protein LOC121055204 n=1 Tax=Oryza brachyantha TaxID=4533 RepID=UPI001ADCCBA4|nr:uncharacterized protein LOC121055204 [Oryza brachyantha]
MQPPAPVEFAHKSHPIPNHKLKLVTADEGFNCDGCKEPGRHERYRCEPCDFDLHRPCALAPPDLPEHRLFRGRAFRLLHTPPPTEPGYLRVCDACGDKVSGFVYHCSDLDLDIHPCCANLPDHVALDGVEFVLCGAGAGAGDVPRQCAFCTEDHGKSCGVSRSRLDRRKVWTYRSCYDGEAMYLHVACVKEIMVQEIIAAGNGGGKNYVIADSVLRGAMKKRSRTGKKAVKCFLKFVLSVIVSVLFGDPTGMAVALIGAVVSNV